MEYFEFYIEGPKELIRKVVEFQPTLQENVYNLAFGDYDEEAKAIGDKRVTNNGDSLKVLATVASTVYAFVEKHCKSWIVATENTEARKRLYRTGLTNNLAEISKDSWVFGYTIDEKWVKFETGEDFEAFSNTQRKLQIIWATQ